MKQEIKIKGRKKIRVEQTLENSVPHLVNQQADNKKAKNSSNLRVLIYLEMYFDKHKWKHNL